MYLSSSLTYGLISGEYNNFHLFELWVYDANTRISVISSQIYFKYTCAIGLKRETI